MEAIADWDWQDWLFWSVMGIIVLAIIVGTIARYIVPKRNKEE